jgi:TPR repeat protein
MFRLVLLSTLTLALLPAAHADSVQDDISLQQALLRRHTSAEAEARYEAYKANPNYAVDAFNAGLSNLASRMYQRGMAKQAAKAAEQERRDHSRHVLDHNQPIDINSRSDGQLLADLLWRRSDGDNEWFATELLVKYALGQAPGDEFVFPEPDPAFAAALLREKTFSADPKERESWAPLQLATLYLTGDGVPRDEAAAVQILTRCAESSPAGLQFGNRERTELPAFNEMKCRLLLATVHENGWGVDRDEKKAQALRESATQLYNDKVQDGPDWTLEQIRRFFKM